MNLYVNNLFPNNFICSFFVSATGHSRLASWIPIARRLQVLRSNDTGLAFWKFSNWENFELWMLTNNHATNASSLIFAKSVILSYSERRCHRSFLENFTAHLKVGRHVIRAYPKQRFEVYRFSCGRRKIK